MGEQKALVNHKIQLFVFFHFNSFIHDPQGLCPTGRSTCKCLNNCSLENKQKYFSFKCIFIASTPIQVIHLATIHCLLNIMIPLVTLQNIIIIYPVIKQTHCLLSKHWVHLVVRHNHFSIKGSVMSMVHTQPHTREEVAMLWTPM